MRAEAGLTVLMFAAGVLDRHHAHEPRFPHKRLLNTCWCHQVTVAAAPGTVAVATAGCVQVSSDYNTHCSTAPSEGAVKVQPALAQLQALLRLCPSAVQRRQLQRVHRRGQGGLVDLLNHKHELVISGKHSR